MRHEKSTMNYGISEGARDKTEKESGSQIECLAKGLDFYSIGDGNH